MSDIAYFIKKDQVQNVIKNMDVGSSWDKIHKMIKNRSAKKVYIVTNFKNGEGRVVVAEINIKDVDKQLYIDEPNKWRYRVKGDQKSKPIVPPIPFHKRFPKIPFHYANICYV